MIRGALNDRLEPMVVLEISSGDGRFHPVEALLDTGFTEDLTLPPDTVARLGLEHVERIPINLADDRRIDAHVYEGVARWFGQDRRIYVIAAEGHPLLGMNLLADCKITIRARPGGEVAIEEDSDA